MRFPYSSTWCGLCWGSLNRSAPKFHLTPTIEIDLFLGLTITFHWLGIRAWVRPWFNSGEAERTRIIAEGIVGKYTKPEGTP